VVLGRREHASTISRRLRNANWRTWDWYVCLYQHTLTDLDRYERQWLASQPGAHARHWMAIVDTTYHATHAEVMENVLLFNRRPKSQCPRSPAQCVGDGRGPHRHRRPHPAAAAELLHPRLLPTARPAVSHAGPTGGRHAARPRVAGGRRVAGRLRQRV